MEAYLKKTVVFAWFANHVGGLEQLILIRTRWFLGRGYRVVILTTDGPMTPKYEHTGATVATFSRFENDFVALGERRLMRRLREVDALIGGSEAEVFYIGYDQKSFWVLARMAQLRPAGCVRLVLEYVAPKIFYGFLAKELQEFGASRRIICINEASRLYLDSRHGVTTHPSVVVPIPVSVALPSAAGAAPNSSAHPIVVTAARLEDMKEYLFGMVEGAGLFFREFPDGLLVVVGDGSYRPELTALAAKHGPRVIFTGLVDPSEYCDLIKRGTVFVGMGTASVQAAAIGLPVVIATAYDRTFSSPGYLSEQAPGDFGEEVAGRVPTDGWELVLRLLRDRRELLSEARACQTYASNVFDPEQNMRRFDEIMLAVPLGLPEVSRPVFPKTVWWKRTLKKILITLRIR